MPFSCRSSDGCVADASKEYAGGVGSELPGGSAVNSDVARLGVGTLGLATLDACGLNACEFEVCTFAVKTPDSGTFGAGMPYACRLLVPGSVGKGLAGREEVCAARVWMAEG